MKKVFLKEKSDLLRQNYISNETKFTKELIKDLPDAIKKYLQVCGYMNKPVPVNANVHWKKCFFKLSPKKEWKEITTLQFNSVKPVARVAYMKFCSMPISGRDIYKDGYGEMKVKLFNLFRIAYDNSKETAQSALITSFAEFLIIPGYFISENITWKTINDNIVQATLTDNGIEVSGLFYFNKEGLMYRFETEDRFYSISKSNCKKIKFSGLVESFKNVDGITIAENVKVMWHLPEGVYEYYKGTIEKIDFNVSE